MNNKNRKLRGFTLIEMIICIALFSIIMLCAFKIYEPVSNMFRSANISERSYSYTNNIENIVQSRLDNADNVWIYTGRMDDGDLANICNMIKENYYNGMIIGTGTGETTDAPAIGTMHIMHVLNSDLNTASENYPSGQIVLSDFDFECAETESIRESDVEGAYDASIGLLPDAYFNANGYRFS
ncbi:MAG: prepilin-type N-terminal cleavage/methylation domain-containing protein [Ruminococcus sp.]|nr:prepilin-type N-terminal cleavage/methylation domain-containing protein [Ruminococcus sp.]